MVNEKEVTNIIPWSPTFIGSVPTQPELNAALSTRKPFTDENHNQWRVLKNSICNLPPGILETDREQVMDLQKRIEVAVMAAVFKSEGKVIQNIPSPETLQQIQEQLEINIEPIVMDKRPPMGLALSAGIGLMPIADFELRREITSEQKQAAMEQVELAASGRMVEIGLLSKGVGYAFERLNTRLNTAIVSGLITEAQKINILNSNFGFAAVRHTNNENERNINDAVGGVSLSILDKIVELSNDNQLQINICDDIIQSGRTLAAVIDAIQQHLVNAGLDRTKISGIMSRITLSIPIYNECIFEQTEKGYSWHISRDIHSQGLEVQVPFFER